MTKQIDLGHGIFATIDDDIFDYLSQWKWNPQKNEHTCYAKRTQWHFGLCKTIRMHRVIYEYQFGEIPNGFVIDHINGDGLDNRLENLRICLREENAKNTRSYIGKSKYKGVQPTRNGKYESHITLNKKIIYLGTFEDESEAAKAYDKAAARYHKEFASFNFPDDWT